MRKRSEATRRNMRIPIEWSIVYICRMFLYSWFACDITKILNLKPRCCKVLNQVICFKILFNKYYQKVWVKNSVLFENSRGFDQLTVS